jgi:hypothetical protein
MNIEDMTYNLGNAQDEINQTNSTKPDEAIPHLRSAIEYLQNELKRMENRRENHEDVSGPDKKKFPAFHSAGLGVAIPLERDDSMRG